LYIDKRGDSYEIGVIQRDWDWSEPSTEALFVRKRSFCKKSHIHQIFIQIEELEKRRKWFEKWSF